jgi:hypothetical protein
LGLKLEMMNIPRNKLPEGEKKQKVPLRLKPEVIEQLRIKGRISQVIEGIIINHLNEEKK